MLDTPDSISITCLTIKWTNQMHLTLTISMQLEANDQSYARGTSCECWLQLSTSLCPYLESVSKWGGGVTSAEAKRGLRVGCNYAKGVRPKWSKAYGRCNVDIIHTKTWRWWCEIECLVGAIVRSYRISDFFCVSVPKTNNENTSFCASILWQTEPKAHDSLRTQSPARPSMLKDQKLPTSARTAH